MSVKQMLGRLNFQRPFFARANINFAWIFAIVLIMCYKERMVASFFGSIILKNKKLGKNYSGNAVTFILSRAY